MIIGIVNNVLTPDQVDAFIDRNRAVLSGLSQEDKQAVWNEMRRLKCRERPSSYEATKNGS